MFGVGREGGDDADVCAVRDVFLTFWWELARWLDSWLLGVLYSSDTHSSWNLAGIQNSQDDVIINLVMGSMFLVLPTFWLGAMTWAGVRVGVAVNGALTGGVKVAQDSGGRLGDDWEVTQLTTRYGGK